MDRKNIVYVVTGIAISFLVLYGVYSLLGQNESKGNLVNNPLKKTDEVILYWGEECAHCKNVDEYLKSHQQIEQKIKIEKKEVYDNKTNAADLEEKAAICKYDASQGVPVPFLYFKGECVVGDQPIIDYLKNVTKS